MLKQIINDFKIKVGEKCFAAVGTPVSALSVISEACAIGDPYFGVNARSSTEIFSDGCSFESVFRVDSVIYSQRRVMLSLKRVDAPCSVILNGTEIVKCNGGTDDCLIDVKDLLSVGENTLVLRFLPEEPLGFSASFDRISKICIGGCELICFNDDIITEVGVKREMCDGFVRLEVSVSTLESKGSVRAVATIVSPGGRIYYCGISGGRGSIDITEPNLWWPSGYGVQNLYKLTVNLYADEEIADSVDMRLGLADVGILPWDGEGMPAVTVNAIPIFSRGACYVSDDMLSPYLDPSRIKDNLTRLYDMGANTLVLRDIGVFPGDIFFKICDELGIIIWSEIKSKDPETLKREIASTFKKVKHHASFGPMLCENEEIVSIVNEIIPDAIAIVVPSVDEICIKSTASVPDVRTLLRVTPSEELNIFSEEIKYHSTLDKNISLIDSEHFRFPNGIRDVGLVSSYIESMSVRDIIEWKRRERRSDLGVIISRFNDPWPTVSESVVDYYCRRKPQYYILRNLFAPVMISAYNEGTRVTFSVSNEMKNEYSGRFSYSVVTNTGESLFHDEFDVTVAEREAMDVLTIDLAEAVGGRIDECFVTYSVSDGFITSSKGTLLFTSPKKFKFLKPTFSTEISGSGTHFVISVSSDVPADKVYFDFETVEASFDENYIFIDDSSPRRIEFTTSSALAIEILRRELKVRSLYDIGRN